MLPPAGAAGRGGGRMRPSAEWHHLGAREELRLVRLAAAGDTQALSSLVAAHLPLAVRCAAPFQRPGVQLDDLVGDACVGLIEAVGRFDPDRGFRFMTYAVWWVR